MSSKTTTTTITPLRQRMQSRTLSTGTQIGHLRGCKRFAAYLKRSPDTATVDEVRLFQLHLIETASICTRKPRRAQRRSRWIGQDRQKVQIRRRAVGGLAHVKLNGRPCRPLRSRICHGRLDLDRQASCVILSRTMRSTP